MALVGRIEEQRVLRDRFDHDGADFVVVCGRRRVGKTFLVREFFNGRFCFTATGVAKQPKGRQLREFNRSLSIHGGIAYAQAPDWFESFQQLRQLIEHDPTSGKKVVFLDELPWMDTPKSGFLPALESFWNGWASGRRDVLLIVAGSSASWIARKLFRNTGGLYNRVTRRLWLQPFTLAECEAFFEDRRVGFDRQQQVESYMIFGGIPHYLDQLDRGLSLAQNVDRLCFGPNPPLGREFDELYASLFAEPARHVAVVKALAGKASGLGRDEISRAAHIAAGGTLSAILEQLELSGFVRSHPAFGKRERDLAYRLADPFSLFALRFGGNRLANDEHFWTNGLLSGGRNAWKGHAFEEVCLGHIPQIKRALGIAGVLSSASAWRSRFADPGAQIDLVIDRADRVINLCEIKYSDHEYAITADYDRRLRAKRAAFSEETRTTKSLAWTFITTYGLARNAHRGSVSSEVTMNDLFEHDPRP
ncbi:MAG: hypothetical protein LBK95_16665 [Bifidobacteriaceae bacterium]|jgi:predicted AAA+ superfamily ATPase|nr:hypothetical protein [Bifidobacteriaceae bacterium]